jgi:hypothetical protein
LKFHLAIATIAVALLTAFTPAARAQQPNPQMAAEIQAFQKSLNVTPDQQKKLTAIQAKYGPKMQAIMDKLRKQGGAKPTPELQQKLMKQWATETKPLIEAQRKETAVIFTPAQNAKIKAFQAKMAAKMKGGKG